MTIASPNLQDAPGCCPKIPGAGAPELVLAAHAVLAQGMALLGGLGDARYSAKAGAPFNASIGGHYRHVLEHFQCLLEGIDSGIVDYDARRRNLRIESEPAFALLATQTVIEQLASLSASSLRHDCMTVSSVAYESPASPTVHSSVARELAYCIGHAIHHYAMIRLICGVGGIELPAEFGYAPSTLKHQATHSGR